MVPVFKGALQMSTFTTETAVTVFLIAHLLTLQASQYYAVNLAYDPYVPFHSMHLQLIIYSVFE